MRINEPVTQRDMGMDNETEIISTTDLKGILTSANDDFIHMSGFTWEELMGKNHNIIRHPDMPPEAFSNLWETLKAGKPWMGIVKTVTGMGRPCRSAVRQDHVEKNGRRQTPLDTEQR